MQVKGIKSLGVLIVMLLSIQFLYAQQHDNIWLFGYDSNSDSLDFGGSVMEFSDDTLEIYFEFRDMNMNITNASICDTSGNLLFYTNGIYVANTINDTMENGFGLNPGPFADDHWQFGYILDQGAIVLPVPESDDSLFYLIHADRIYPTPQLEWHSSKLYYSLIDMSLNNGLGEVVEKNEVIISGVFDLGKITATKHANGIDWWILIRDHNSNAYHTILVTKDEIIELDVQEVGDPFLFGIGQSVFSPDGRKYAVYSLHSIAEGNFLNIYDFDRCYGLLSNPVQENIVDSSWSGGAAISSNSQYLYVSSYNYVYQYDLFSDDILASKDTVAVYDGFEVEISPTFFLPTRFFLMQLAPDDKIYINCPAGVNVLHVIENPNEPGEACNVIQHGIQLPTYNLVSMPNFPNYRLGALSEGACDTTTAILDSPESYGLAVQINPNPASFYTTLGFSEMNMLNSSTWEIYSLTGQLILNGRAGNDKQEIDVSQWPSGVYFVKVILSEGNYFIEKLIVQSLRE